MHAYPWHWKGFNYLLTKPTASNIILFPALLHFPKLLEGIIRTIPKLRDFMVILSQKFKIPHKTHNSELKHSYKIVQEGVQPILSNLIRSFIYLLQLVSNDFSCTL